MSAGQQPNIIFFFSDQQRWDTCGCYGQPLDVTPNLDRMAAEGVRFESAFTCQPVCGPARACLQTGKYATEMGCFKNNIALPQDEKTVPSWLSEFGYEVGYIGKWHLASGHFGTYYTRGVEDTEVNHRETAVPLHLRGGYKDYWLASDVLEFTSHGHDGHMFDAEMNRRDFPEGSYRVDAQTDWVLDYLRSRDGEKPFFLFLSYIEPHHQNDHNHYEGPKGSKERFKDFVTPGDLTDTEGDWRAEYPDYLGCINSLDTALGRIRAELEAQGMADDTLIIYTSDHGSHFRTRNSEYKRSCHDGCIRIPMIACGPGFRGGKVVEELVSLIDVPPTIVAAGGVPVPSCMRGGDLGTLADGTAQEWPEEAFLQISESHCGRTVRTQRWKYSVRAPKDAVRFGCCNSPVYTEDFLYDLQTDPHERRNLVSDPAFADVRADMATRLKRRMVEAGEDEPEIQPVSC